MCFRFDADHKFAPKYDENNLRTIECNCVLAAIGQSIVWGDLLDGEKVELGRGNTAKADSWTYQTAQPDIFVGGDVFTGPRFAIEAIAAGKEALGSKLTGTIVKEIYVPGRIINIVAKG